MENEEPDNGKDHLERKYASVSYYWHYVTFSSMLLCSIGAMLADSDFLGLMALVAFVFQILVCQFAVCPYCGSHLLGKAPKEGELQGEMVLPARICWNCKRDTLAG